LDALPPEVVEEQRAGSTQRPSSGSASNWTSSQLEAQPAGAAVRRYRPGQRVFHPTFGDGVVLTVRESAGDQEVTVQFKRHGTKTLLASLAKLVQDG
jgi:DNA helicase-2/ATP-dependent DNA helicase PcrA